jgi:hypothetical protein
MNAQPNGLRGFDMGMVSAVARGFKPLILAAKYRPCGFPWCTDFAAGVADPWLTLGAMLL